MLNNKQIQHLAWLEFAFEIACIYSLGSKLHDDNMDGKARIAFVLGGILGTAVLSWVILHRDENQDVTGADLAAGLQMPISGLFLGIGLRHAVPAVAGRARALIFSQQDQARTPLLENGIVNAEHTPRSDLTPSP